MRAARHSRERVPHQRRRVPRPRVVPQGRPVLRGSRVHRQPDLCARDHHRGVRRRPARADHAASPPRGGCRASSTASTKAGIRAATRICRIISRPDDLSGKQANADLVRTGLCLRHSDGPLFGVVSRLVHQKGLDIVADTARDIVREGGQIAILGLGDPDTEHMLSRLARSHRDHIGLLIGFNEPMARRIVAASDFCLMPSRFEPCGLTQMQAQRYGSLPIAHRDRRAGRHDRGRRDRLPVLRPVGRGPVRRLPPRVRGVRRCRTCWPRCARRRWRAASTGRAAAAEYEQLYTRLIGRRSASGRAGAGTAAGTAPTVELRARPEPPLVT